MNVLFKEPAGGVVTIAADDADSAVVTVTNILEAENCSDIVISDVEEVATDDEHQNYKNSLN